MPDSDENAVADQLVARFSGAVDELLQADLTVLSGEDVLVLLGRLEVQTRRLASVDQAVIAEVQSRGLAFDRGCRSTEVLLRQVLRISVGAARARTGAARELGPRRGLTGEVLPALFPQVAAAQAAGDVSPAHARVITSTIERLPDGVFDDGSGDGSGVDAAELEAFLVEQARQFAPEQLSTIARRLSDTLDPDGILADERHRERLRDLSLHVRADGSARVDGDLTAACTEALRTVLDATARPAPATEDGARDPRTAGQRRHDGLLDALLTILRTDQLPQANGVSTTILLTLTTDQLEQRLTGLPSGSGGEVDGCGAGIDDQASAASARSTGASGRSGAAGGLVRTGHGTTLTLTEALKLAADARIVPVVFGQAKEVAAYGTSHRIFTESQRLAMIARDQGCTYPGCDVPSLWCQAHHAPDHALTGRTTINEGTLVCGYHHREHQKLGWTTAMRDGTVWWRPPPWIDPDQKLRRNHIHGNHLPDPAKELATTAPRDEPT